MNEGAWKALEEEQANLLPTPPVGEVVQWYKEGETREPRAAQVTGVEGPGRLILKVSSPAAFDETKRGVYHVSWKTHQYKNNQTTKRCGSWDYLPGKNIPKFHYELHQQDLQKRLDSLKAAEAQAILAESRKPKPQPSLAEKVDQLAALVSERLAPQVHPQESPPEPESKPGKPKARRMPVESTTPDEIPI